MENDGKTLEHKMLDAHKTRLRIDRGFQAMTGAVLAGAPEKELAVEQAAENIGLAFQIQMISF